MGPNQVPQQITSAQADVREDHMRTMNLLKKWLLSKSRLSRRPSFADQLQSNWAELWETGSDDAASMDIIC